MPELNPDLIQFVDKVTDWQEAIKIACQPLLQHNFIQNSFIDSLIQETKRLGPYYILSQDLALGHISPNGQTLKNGLGLLYLKEPVCFKGDGTKPVKFLFILTTVDESSHLKILQDLAIMFGNKNFYKEFYEVNSYQDINNLIKKHFN